MASTGLRQDREQPPDTRGPTAPLPFGLFLAGIASLALVIGGSILMQLSFAVGDQQVTQRCVDAGVRLGSPGDAGVCKIVEALASPGQTAFLVLGIALGAVAVIGGFGAYRRMPTRRMREQCIAGAVLGIQAVVLAGLILWVREGDIGIFARNFLNLTFLEGTFPVFLDGVKITLILAFAGEVGGIVIGLILAVLAVSKRKVVRAPALVYVNFFRGTPLIWQLSVGYFGVALGLGIDVESTITVAAVVFALNTGAYAAEVFRAGLQSIERGQIEAARSLGMTYLQAMRYAIVPQAVRRVIPPLMNEFVILIKDTSLITILPLALAERDIFSAGRELYSSTFNATPFMAVAAGYLIITLPMIYVVNAVERRLRSGLVGITGSEH